MTDQEKRSLWLGHIKAYRASKLTAVAWCKENNVKVHILRKWITQFNKEKEAFSGSKEWLPVDVVSDTYENNIKPASSGITITIGAAKIEVSSNFDPNTLEAVLGILSKKC